MCEEREHFLSGAWILNSAVIVYEARNSSRLASDPRCKAIFIERRFILDY